MRVLIEIGNKAEGAAWYYASPLTDRAAGLKDYVAFCTFLGRGRTWKITDEGIFR